MFSVDTEGSRSMEVLNYNHLVECPKKETLSITGDKMNLHKIITNQNVDDSA